MKETIKPYLSPYLAETLDAAVLAVELAQIAEDEEYDKAQKEEEAYLESIGYYEDDEYDAQEDPDYAENHAEQEAMIDRGYNYVADPYRGLNPAAAHHVSQHYGKTNEDLIEEYEEADGSYQDSQG